MNFSSFKYNDSGAGIIWVKIKDTTNNLEFLQQDTHQRINGEPPTTCLLQSEGTTVKAISLDDNNRYFTFTSSAVSEVIDDGNIHLCFIKDMNIDDIHKIKVELVVTFPEDEEEDAAEQPQKSSSYNTPRQITISSNSPKAIIFDTETSGLTSGFNVILQLSYQIVDLTNWNVLKEVNHYFDWPDEEYKVEPEAIFTNGITQEFLEDQVISDKFVALDDFFIDLEGCDLAIAHNLSFDKDFIIEDSLEELVIIDPEEKEWPICIDTMVDTTDYCRLLPKKNGEYKWPKLSELASKLSVKCYDLKLHDSRSDVELTKRCFKKLCESGFYKLDYKEKRQTTNETKLSEKTINFLSAISDELKEIEKNISSDRSCLSCFTLPTPTGRSNMVYLDYNIDSRFEECKDVLDYISPLAYSYVKNQKGSYEAKYTFQNMKDRIDIEISSLSNYMVDNKCIQTAQEVIDLGSATLSILSKVISCFETIINKRFITYYGQPGEPSDFRGLYAVSDFYGKLASLVYKIYLSLDQLISPDQNAKRIFESLGSISYNLYYQVKSYPKESLDKILDIESNPRVRGTIDLACHLTVDKSLSDEIIETLKLYEDSMRNGTIRL